MTRGCNDGGGAAGGALGATGRDRATWAAAFGLAAGLARADDFGVFAGGFFFVLPLSPAMPQPQLEDDQIEKLVPQPHDAVAFGLRIWND